MVASGQAGYSSNSQIFNALYQKYTGGAADGKSYNDDGDVFRFNGSSFVRTYENPRGGLVDTLLPAVPLMVATAGAVGPLATQIGTLSGGAISGAAAQAAAAGVVNAATQLATTGSLDIGQALTAAAIDYGGTALGDFVASNTEINNVLGQVRDVAQEFQSFLETGNSIADAAIKAGGMSALTQLVTTGEINIEQAALSAVIAGGSEAFNKLKLSLAEAGVEEDDYMSSLAEMEEFQQAAIDADIKDPFLNPNYETVGDGSLVHNTITGEVFSVTDNKSLGQFDSLDSNSDGVLSASDLSEIEVTATPVDIGGTITGQEVVPFKYDSQEMLLQAKITLMNLGAITLTKMARFIIQAT